MNTDELITDEEKAIKELPLTKMIIAKGAMSNGLNVYQCCAITGRLSKVKPKKEHTKDEKGQLKTIYYHMATANLCFLSARNIQEAKELFEKQFQEQADKLEEQMKKMNDEKQGTKEDSDKTTETGNLHIVR